MPLYEYQCEECGVFEEFRPLRQANEGAPCPECGEDATRIMSIPNVRNMTPVSRMACERNEKSRHEPRVSSTGCRGHKKTGPEPKRHAYKGPRPWVIEHR